MSRTIKCLVSFCVVIIFGCASQSEKFPEPKEMKPMVTFWERVYSEWNENQAAYHDNRYLDVVYEVVDIPAQNRRDYLRMRENSLRERLEDMVNRHERHQPLDPLQKKWLSMLIKSGGNAAISGAPERLRYQIGLKNRFRRGLEISGAYLPEFKTIMKKHGVPPEIAYLPHVESSFQGRAYSHVGASGMWQFMPSTARTYLPMHRNAIDGRLDPFMAAEGAARYLKEAHGRVEAWPLALTGYNHGVGGMVRAKNQLGPDIGKIVWEYEGDRFKFASRNFYAEFLAAKRIAENSSRYFPDLTPHPPRNVDGVVLFESIKVRDLANMLSVSEFSLIELNPAWLGHVQKSQVNIPANIPVWLPKGSAKNLSSDLVGRL